MTQSSSRRTVFLVSAATACSLLGDQVLYAVLPVLYQDLGLTAIEVGVLLSANRWIRLLTNEVAHRCAHFGAPRTLFVAALLLGAATTAAYVATFSFTLMLCARLLWGLSWSFIRHLGVGAVMADIPAHTVGQTMGTYNGISRAGSVAGLLGGAMLVDWVGFHTGVIVLALISLAGVPLAWRGFGSRIVEREVRRQRAPAMLLAIGVSIGAVGPGFVMATLGAAVANFVAADGLFTAATLTGALLAARYVMDSLFAPWLGRMFDRLGFTRACLTFLMVGGAALIGASFDPGLALFIAAILLFFAAGTAMQAGVAGTASKLGSGAFARYVTASDLGAALGPLLGWVVVAASGNPLYSIGIGGAWFLAAALTLLLRRQTPGPGPISA